MRPGACSVFSVSAGYKWDENLLGCATNKSIGLRQNAAKYIESVVAKATKRRRRDPVQGAIG